MQTAAIVLAFAAAVAGDEHAAPQSADSLRGVELGSGVADLKECPRHANPAIPSLTYISHMEPEFPDEMKGVRCFQSTDERPLLASASSLVISNLPFLKGAGTDVTVNIVDGRIEYIEMRFLQHHGSTILSGLIEKYGTPASSREVPYQNGLGQSFSGTVATWNTPGAVLTFSQYDGQRDWGRVDLMSRAYSATLVNRHDSAVQDARNKL